MTPGVWYEIEFTNQMENLFKWTRIKEFGMNIDRRYLDFKKVDELNNEAEAPSPTVRLIKGTEEPEE